MFRFFIGRKSFSSFSLIFRNYLVKKWKQNGGQTGIRTLGGLAPTPVFKTGAFNHSAICP